MIPGVGSGDEMMQQAVMASLNDTGQHDVRHEPIPQVDKRVREENQPTGLRNIGNTCYFNSLLQVYYALPGCVEKILAFKVDHELLADKPVQQQDQAAPAGGEKKDDSLKTKLVKSGMNLIKELQILFTTMALGKKKYLNPSGVLQAVVDDQGDKLAIGDEKDITEYNVVLLQRIQDAFDYVKDKENEAANRGPAQRVGGDNDNPDPEVNVDMDLGQPPALDTQSSFAEFKDSTPGSAAAMDVDLEEEIKTDNESPADVGAFMKTFVCNVRRLIHFSDKDGKEIVKQSWDQNTDIILGIQEESDFYKAWENVFADENIDYQADDGSNSKARSTTWIERLPEVLTFQMQRSAFEKNRLVKKNHEHPILPEIYPDRFMYDNFQMVENLRTQVKEHRSKISYLKKCLDQYSNFNGSGISIESALAQVLFFY